MKTITEEHRARLKELHARDPNFGVIGYLWADRVTNYMTELGCVDALDYGCGRSNLSRELALRNRNAVFFEYDPATAPGEPEPADFVTCIDVLEHCEQALLPNVLKDLARLTRKGGLITVSLRLGTRKNRRSHPMANQTREFWLTLIGLHFRVEEVAVLDPTKAKSEVAMFVRPLLTEKDMPL